MLASIGLLIFIKQFPHVFGVKFEAHEFFEYAAEIPRRAAEMNYSTFTIAAVCLGLFFLLTSRVGAAIPGLRRIPPQLTVVVAPCGTVPRGAGSAAPIRFAERPHAAGRIQRRAPCPHARDPAVLVRRHLPGILARLVASAPDPRLEPHAQASTTLTDPGASGPAPSPSPSPTTSPWSPRSSRPRHGQLDLLRTLGQVLRHPVRAPRRRPHGALATSQTKPSQPPPSWPPSHAQPCSTGPSVSPVATPVVVVATGEPPVMGSLVLLAPLVDVELLVLPVAPVDALPSPEPPLVWEPLLNPAPPLDASSPLEPPELDSIVSGNGGTAHDMHCPFGTTSASVHAGSLVTPGGSQMGIPTSIRARQTAHARRPVAASLPARSKVRAVMQNPETRSCASIHA